MEHIDPQNKNENINEKSIKEYFEFILDQSKITTLGNIKTTLIRVYGKSSISVTRNLIPNTDTLIKSEDLNKVYQPFTSIHSDTL